ncbi:ABC transporter ATP-binding protein [Nonomuraea sp. NPDC049695]|uniref:ABC transporter ATP-binding protein n=1 Tax=Nonomuraea sp. NPDC049695 TaxID=3154734 RepID=UPI003419A443
MPWPDPDAGPAAVELEDLRKVYPGAAAPAVDQVTLTMPAGQVFGLLGRNGAGKTTIIRMIATLLLPTSGRVRVSGLDTRVRQKQVRGLLGVALGGERSVYWKLTGRQNLEYFAALHGLSRRRSRERIQEILERMELADRADDHVEQYSTGMRQRLVIARALLNRPAVLLLDEPTNGLDVHAAENLHQHIRELRRAGHSIVLTTHDMAEADALADRIGIIDRGSLIAEGRPDELKQRVGAAQVINMRFRDPGAARIRSLTLELEEIAEVGVERDAGRVAMTLMSKLSDDLVPCLIAVFGRHGIAVQNIESEPVSLRDAFLALTAAGADAR